ncbi:MAG: phospholipase D-like domain-containing protein [candidate division Zixibacteria bacterium]|nr:phospholipase D-like domain-containing protein [candidate division Zixibacteria bacterium]
MPIHYGDSASLLKELFDDAESEIIIVSAFTTSEATTYLLQDISSRVTISLVTRWSKYDILSGSSDLGVADIVSQRKGRVFRNSNLHAKLYMIDKGVLLFGSANMTGRGLGIGNMQFNIECLSCPEKVRPDDIFFVNSIIKNSEIIDQALLNELSMQLTDKETSDWNESRIKEVRKLPQGIFVNDFPFCEDPEELLHDQVTEFAEHDVKLLNIVPSCLNFEEISRSFETSTVIKWLEKTLIGRKSFGELSKEIHDSLLDDPKPYRKEVKELQKNLFNWITKLLTHKFHIYVPEGGHSQFIDKEVHE